MGFMIEITENKFDKMAEYTEKMLKYGGKLMSCISELGEEHGMSFRGEGSYRGGYGSRYSGGSSMGYREDDDWEEMNERYEDEMGERRGRRRRDSRGRYM